MSEFFVPIETAALIWRDEHPFSKDFEDIYFSKENGLAETEHVFIKGNRLIERWQALDVEETSTFVIAETGFGSGLNFLLSWSLWLQHAPKSARLHFLSCEKFPLKSDDLKRCLALWPQLQEQAEALLADYPVLTPGFHHLQFANGRVNLTLMLGEATSCFKQLLVCGDYKLEGELRRDKVDAWFLDGFSPAKNAEMWSSELFHTIALLSGERTSLATFSAAAVVKNSLKEQGFVVQKLKGFGRKREMVIAQFQEHRTENRKLRSTPWHLGLATRFKGKRAIVIGAGLAGCYCAHALAKRGWQVSLVDEQAEVGQGASANTQAVLYPKLSSYRSPLTQFMLTAFLFANRIYNKLLNQHALGDLSGILQLAFDEKECLSQASLKDWLSAYPELGVLVNAEQASRIAGIALDLGGLFIPQSGWFDSQALCRLLSQTEGIELLSNTSVSELIFEQGLWHAAVTSAEVLILANGYQAKQFSQVSYLPLKPIRGQMTMIAANNQSKHLRLPLCGDGHVLPARKQMHAIGATYHLGSDDRSTSAADDAANLARLVGMPTGLSWSAEARANWAGVRGATTDYLPIVGPVPDQAQFRERFASLSTNAKRWIPLPSVCYPGLFICAGFGSRGLTTVPLCAEWLAATINGEPSILPRLMVQSLAPARFLHKDVIKNLR